MVVLITGLGYIGSQLAWDLLARGEEVVAVENFFCTPRAAVAPLLRQKGLTLIEGSINSTATLRRALSTGPVQAVVHLAAQPSGHPLAAPASYTEQTNLAGARLTLEEAIAADVERVVLGSSFKVYGDDLPPLVNELQPYGQVGDLAHLSKIYVEKLAEMMAFTRGLRCVAVRLGITYGLGPVMKADPRFLTVPNRFSQLAVQGQSLAIHPTATRPAGFIHLQDASAALLAALALDLDRPYLPVNAVSECATVGQVAGAVQEAGRQRGLSVQITGPQPQHSSGIMVQTSLPRSLFRPRRRLDESLGEVVDYFAGQASHVERS